jgi:ankyrin repeat protein
MRILIAKVLRRGGTVSKQLPPGRITMMKRSMAWVLALAACGPAAFGGQIHEAAELGQLDRVKASLAQDPKQIDTLDAKGRTVLARAALSGKQEMVELLLEKGAKEDIYIAAIVGHAAKVAAFLQEDKTLLNAKDLGGKAPLHWAALYGQKKIVELLLAAKADVNLTDQGGFTPLHWAAMFDKSEVVSVLLTNKADLTARVPQFGWTPLRLAVIHGHMATAKTLLKGGADPNLRDDVNIPLLHQAVIRGKGDMVELLLASKAEINYKDPEGETALAEAEEQGNREIMEILRKHGGRAK